MLDGVPLLAGSVDIKDYFAAIAVTLLVGIVNLAAAVFIFNKRAKVDKKQDMLLDKKISYQDNTDRIEVERTFSLSKRCYGMSCITTKLEETQLTSIALSVFVTNLFRIQRRILCALASVPIWHDRNKCKSWKLQIAA